MSDNIPDQITDYLRSASNDFDRESFYWFSAIIICLFYLNKDLTNPVDNNFMEIRRTSRNGIWYGYAEQVILIGKTLFLLRSAPGFPELCWRMNSRDLRSTYFEAYAAQMFFECGYKVSARPEAGIRGVDFDFQARRNEETINVEVTALTPKKFSLQTVENALYQKRKQLPDAEPAMIVCVLPESWFETPMGVAPGNLTKDFFQRTRRVLAVLYMIEKHFEHERDGPIGHLQIQHVCLFHPNPRFPIGSAPFSNEWWKTNSAPTGPVTQRRDSEFFDWADSMFLDKNE